MQIGRRQFTQLTGTAILTAGPLTAQRTPLTAQQVIDRIQANAGVPWQAGTLDAVKDGDPAIPLTGIATTAMATADVLSRAVAEKCNLVITLEPVFFGRLDGQTPPAVPPAPGRGGPPGLSPDDP